MKTPEEMAKEWYWANLTEESPVVMLTNPVKHPPCPRKAFLAGYQAAQPQWISVKDRLPAVDTRVLVYEDGVTIVNAISSLNHRWDLYDNGENCRPTHWMPLPKPPEKI